MSEDGANTGDKAESRRWGRDRRKKGRQRKLIKDLYPGFFLPLLSPYFVKLYMLGTAKCERSIHDCTPTFHVALLSSLTESLNI